MKKASSKLKLNKKTISTLQANDLKAVKGEREQSRTIEITVDCSTNNTSVILPVC